MDSFERALQHRTGAVNARLPKGSRLLLLDPVELSRVLRAGTALLCAPAPVSAVLPGVMRAARESGAPLGVACPYVPGDREAPTAFFQAACAAAQEARFAGPLFLQAGPLRLSEADSENAGRLADAVARFVDAGFGLVSIDASRLSFEGAARLCAAVARPAVEQEVAVELSLPRTEPGEDLGEAASKFLAEAVEEGLAARFVRLGTPALEPLSEPAAALENVANMATGFGAALTLEDSSAMAQQGARGWVAAGVRKLDAASDLGRVSTTGLPLPRREELMKKASAAKLPLTDVLALVADAVAGAGAARRVEALAYVEALALFEALDATGSGTEAIGALSGEE